MPLVCYPVSALEKVFIDEQPAPYPQHIPLTALKNELISFQIAATWTKPCLQQRKLLWVDISCPLPFTLRRVEQVPVRYPCQPESDNNYLRKTPGLYPDALSVVDMGKPVPVYAGQWCSLWVDLEIDTQTRSGEYSFHISFRDEHGCRMGETEQVFCVIDAILPLQTLIHTRWLHTDALVDAYDVPMFSHEHFDILDRFISLAVKRGVNMMLVPTHTPPLDTRQGGERRTAQLVDIFYSDGQYRFGFDKLRRYIAICKRAGVTYYEIAHLFSQWGAYHPPKIIANVDGKETQLFGWSSDAISTEYQSFLAAYLPALIEELKSLEIAQHCYFHISDEPNKDQITQYRAAKNMVLPYLEGMPVIDAMSDFCFYDDGTIEHPVPALDHLDPFLNANVDGLWTYYCVGQSRDVSNTFIAMPSSRTRILGLQLYIYGIKGFLQWAYNYFYAQYSDYYVNPWNITDADGFAPAGDAFQVYPGKDRHPVESLRLVVFFHALQDLRALQAIEAAYGREKALDLIGEGLERLPTLTEYPHDSDYILSLRFKINNALEKAASYN